jgi:RND family efflux transporter MFP subunit
MHRNTASPLGVAAGLVAVLCLSGCTETNTFVEPPPPEVTVANPRIDTVTVFNTAPGRLAARDAVNIQARVSGYLRSIDFVDGELVEAGQPLCVIEPEPYIAAREAARADLDGAKANKDIAQTNYDRRKQAYDKSRAVSEVDVLQAKADLDAATAAVLAAEAALTRAELDLSYTTNYAPVAGRISRKLVSEGNLVGGADATLITTLVVEHPIYLYFNANERQLLDWIEKHGRVEANEDPQSRMRLRLANGQIYEHPGDVDFLDNRVDPETGTIEVRAIFPNPKGELFPGLYGDLMVPDVRENAVLVPDLCIQRDIGGTYVLVVDPENKVESRYITPGPKLEDQRIIEEGLDGSERVVIQGVQRARPGIVVTPSLATTAAGDGPTNAESSE